MEGGLGGGGGLEELSMWTSRMSGGRTVPDVQEAPAGELVRQAAWHHSLLPLPSLRPEGEDGPLGSPAEEEDVPWGLPEPKDAKRPGS